MLRQFMKVHALPHFLNIYIYIHTACSAVPQPTARGGPVGWGTALQAVRSRVQFPMASLCFGPHNGPGVDSASNTNEYQEYFLGRTGGRCVRLTKLPSSSVDCRELWEPQPPGTLRSFSRPLKGLLYLCSIVTGWAEVRSHQMMRYFTLLMQL